MLTAVLKAHFDGNQIVLDEPFELTANSPLIVTVFSPEAVRSDWANLGVLSLARAYGDDEPDYTVADIEQE